MPVKLAYDFGSVSFTLFNIVSKILVPTGCVLPDTLSVHDFFINNISIIPIMPPN